MTKRILALVMAIALMATLFVGCKGGKDTSSIIWEYDYEYVEGEGTGEDGTAVDADGNPISGTTGNKNNSNKNNNNKNNNKGENKAPTVVADSNTNKTGFPIVKKKETLTIMTVTRADLGDIAKSEFDSEVEKLTGLQIDWQLSTEGEINGKKVLALQSGNMPDIFSVAMTDDEMLRYSKEGKFYELNKDILNEWAPNVVKTMDLFSESWTVSTTTDGKIFSLPGFTADYNYAQHYMFVRVDWLEKLGMKKSDIKTTQDFYNMLVAFRDKDPNGNGLKDEIPYATWSHGGFVFQPWGFVKTIAVDNKGKVHNMYTTQNMKNGVNFWAKVYKENLVEKDSIDSFTGSNAAFMSLMNSGKVGCFFYGWPNMGDELMSKYEALPYPVSTEGNGDFPTVAIQVTDPIVRGTLTISSKCKNPSAALRFIDFLYTDDGYMMKLYGKEGKAYVKTGDGNYKLTGVERSTNAGPAWSVKGKIMLTESKIVDKPISIMYQRRYAIDDWCEATLKTNGQKFMPTAFKTQEEVNAEKLYLPYWNTVSDVYYDFIKGDRNMSTDWTTLQNEMVSKGMNKYFASLQAYYDRCNK